MPDLSVIIPTWNRPKALRECLASLVKSDLPLDRFEVIVVDDGSAEMATDQLGEFQAALSLVVIRQENAGAAAARNRGALQARGRFFAFTDDDCLVELDWARLVLARLQTDPRAAVGGITTNAHPESACSRVSHFLAHKDYGTYQSDASSVQFFGSNNLALSKEVFVAVRGFDTQLRPAYEDREFCNRLVRHSIRMVYAPEARIRHNRLPTLSSFVRQHFGYGRGACLYYRLDACPRRPERFHLLACLLEDAVRGRNGLRGWRDALLIIAAQIIAGVGLLVAAGQSLFGPPKPKTAEGPVAQPTD